MLHFFLPFTVSNDQVRYSLYPPFLSTDVGEIGNWSLRQHAANFKRFIRVSAKAEDDYGVVCYREPTMFQDWEISMEIKTRGDEAGHTISFFFTDIPCLFDSLSWNGFAVWIDTEKNEQGECPVRFVNASGTDPPASEYILVGHTNAINTDMNIVITKQGEKLSMTNNGKQVFSQEFKGLLKHGYATLGSYTKYSGNNVDLYSMKIEHLSSYDVPEYPYDISHKNRAILEHAKEERATRKSARRAEMKYTGKYLAELTEANSKLTGKQQDLSDSFRIVNDAVRRAKSNVNKDELVNFINANIQQTIEKASAKVNMAFDRFEETKENLNEMWDTLISQLRGLGGEANKGMKEIEDEVTAIASDYVEEWHYGQGPAIDIDSKSLASSDWLTKIFVGISVLELVGYVSFFLYKRKKTHGFKSHED